MIKKFQFLLIKSVTIIFLTLNANADYPNTSMAVIDLNYILSEADAAKDAAEQIEEIAISIENEIKKSDEDMVNEQNKLIESQAIMAPESFEKKREEYEKKVQNYNIERQQKLLSIDNLVNMSRGQVLEALKPILEEISNEKMSREFKVDYSDFDEDIKVIKNEIDTLSLMEKARNFFKKNGLLLNWKEFEKLDQSQKINTLAMIAPVTNEEKQKLLEAISITDKVHTLESIISFYLYETGLNNQTIQ